MANKKMELAQSIRRKNGISRQMERLGVKLETTFMCDCMHEFNQTGSTMKLDMPSTRYIAIS